VVAPRRQRSRPPRNGRGHSHGDGHHHHDLNLRAAYLHVLADALTSVLAIVALAGGRLFGWDWLDPVMGIVGAAVITVCAWGLLKQTRRVLLDREMDAPVVQVRDVIEGDGEAVVADLHVWRVGSGENPGRDAVAVASDIHTVTASPGSDRRGDRGRSHSCAAA